MVFECSFLCAGDFFLQSWEERRSKTSPSARKRSLPPLLKRRGKVSVAYYRSLEERRGKLVERKLEVLIYCGRNI